jgi:hypothetical protein
VPLGRGGADFLSLSFCPHLPVLLVSFAPLGRFFWYRTRHQVYLRYFLQNISEILCASGNLRRFHQADYDNFIGQFAKVLSDFLPNKFGFCRKIIRIFINYPYNSHKSRLRFPHTFALFLRLYRHGYTRKSQSLNLHSNSA